MTNELAALLTDWPRNTTTERIPIIPETRMERIRREIPHKLQRRIDHGRLRIQHGMAKLSRNDHSIPEYCQKSMASCPCRYSRSLQDISPWEHWNLSRAANGAVWQCDTDWLDEVLLREYPTIRARKSFVHSYLSIEKLLINY
jgi:hypothetical protein